uniref:Uncharacterized protein n=1 Tax=Chrysemys picta bellii TaxID=8478 RepID=A0A8C3FD44_CHRPI
MKFFFKETKIKSTTSARPTLKYWLLQLTQSSSPSFSCLFITWKRKTSFPPFHVPNDFSVWNELVQRKKIFFLQ